MRRPSAEFLALASRRSLAVWGAIALYLTAALGSSGLHVHPSGHSCAAHAHVPAATSLESPRRCCHHHHGCPTKRSTPEPASPRPGDAPLQDDDCSACRFLAQKPLPPQPVAVIEPGDVLPASPVVRPLRPALRPIALPTVRGPPCV